MSTVMPPINTPDNLFHDGNVITGEKGTIVPAVWLNNVQDGVRGSQQQLIALGNPSSVLEGDALVAVKQPYANAVGQTQHDKNSRHIEVEDFGAVGDGVTDDAPAFQAALNSGAKNINLDAKKVYKLVNGVDITGSNITLNGNGARVYYPQTTATYYHALRVSNASNVTITNVNIYSDASLVRDDTGFAISVLNSGTVSISNCSFSSIASATIWCADSSFVSIVNNYITSPKADGIHFSDGCSNFVASGNIISGCHDDSIAVVSDIAGDGRTPLGGVISGNVVSNSFDGHGTLLIGCLNITVTGNTYRGLAGPAIGSYFWNAGPTPALEDWVSGCIIDGNLMESCGLNPTNAFNACSVFVGAMRDCTISNNRISAAPAAPTLGASGMAIQMANAVNVSIVNNTIHDSSDYGIGCLDSMTTGALNFDRIMLDKNRFERIAEDSIHFSPASGEIGRISITNNEHVDSPYSGTFSRILYVSKTQNNKLLISGNNAADTSYNYTYDTNTCLNVVTYNNTPAVNQSFTPVVAPLTGAWTSTSGVQGYYNQSGGVINVVIKFNVLDKGTGAGCKVNLPKSLKSSSYPAIFSGREGINGKLLNGIFISTAQAQIFDYQNADPISNGVSISITMSYVPA